MKQSSSHTMARSSTAADVRGAEMVAEGRELYPSQNAAAHGGRNFELTTGVHRLRERIERARNANLNS